MHGLGLNLGLGQGGGGVDGVGTCYKTQWKIQVCLAIEYIWEYILYSILIDIIHRDCIYLFH